MKNKRLEKQVGLDPLILLEIWMSIFIPFSAQNPPQRTHSLHCRKDSNLRVFTFAELKSATQNFSCSLKVGQGGFDGVYRGVIQSKEVPHKRMDIAVKKMQNTEGLQGYKFICMQTCGDHNPYSLKLGRGWKLVMRGLAHQSHYHAERSLNKNLLKIFRGLKQRQSLKNCKGIGKTFFGVKELEHQANPK